MKLILFNDLVGRTIIGEVTEEVVSGNEVLVKNPAIIHIQPVKGGAPGQLQVQVIPFLIKEFIAASVRNHPVTWSFSRAAVSVPLDLDIEPNLVKQYAQLFNPSPIITPADANTPVINLFDK